MRSNVYTCNGCRKILSFEDYPPVGDPSVGFTCPECSKHAKEITGELEARLRQCGKDGRITKDYYTNKLTPNQLSIKYGCTEKQVLDSIGLCMGYSTGEKRKEIPYDEWVKEIILETETFLTPCSDESYIIGDDPRHPDSVISGEMPSDEHLIAIGKIVAASTRLEETVSTCFSVLLGCEPELASILADSLSVRARCDTLFHIFAYRLGSAEMIRSGKDPKRDRRIRLLSDLFKKIGEATSIRDKIMHSTWSSDTEDEQKVHRFKWRKMPAKPGFPSEDYSLLSAEEILRNVTFIDEVRHELYLFLWEHFGAWMRERAKNKEGGLEIL